MRAHALLAAISQPVDPVLAQASDLDGILAFVDSGAPGTVLVIVRGDLSAVLGYGETAKGNKCTPDGRSLLRLNSITITTILAATRPAGRATTASIFC